jgi:hypothetical protein
MVEFPMPELFDRDGRWLEGQMNIAALLGGLKTGATSSRGRPG